jgi:hypothetical protein
MKTMHLHISNLRNIFIALFAIVALCSCDQADEKFKSYSVGFSTPNVKVWVSSAYLDQHIGILGGSIKGAWGEGGAFNSVTDAPMPHEVYVNWEEDKTKLRYEATVKLVDDLAKRAKALPPFRYDDPEVEQARKREEGPNFNRGIVLIIGLAPNGKVTVWLSNYPYSRYITGRVLEVVGEAQGTLTKDVTPYYPSNKTQH